MKLDRPTGWFHWALPLMIALGATDVLLSQRNLSLAFAELAGLTETFRHPAMPWIQRAVSLVLLLMSAERIAAHFASREPLPSASLTGAYIAFWIGTVASPALLGAHREISHEFLYTLVIGFAAMVVTTAEIGRIADRARDALFVLMLASICLVPIWPTLVLDESYTQGLMPGVPRLGGLAPHPVAMGMLAQLGLLLLWARPYAHRWLSVLAWLLGLSVLFFAQSKTAWMGFLLCAIAMLVVRHGPSAWRRIADPREGAFGIMVCLGVMFVGSAVLALVLFVDLGGNVSDFLATDQGVQLMTLTGRDQIWAIAWEEWDAHKWFGYGPGLFDDDFRLAIHMPNATNAHNQFMDTLARSGTVGAVVLVVYAVVLLVLSLRYARRTGGLSAALFIALALRSVSEVPLTLFGYGLEFFAQLLLIVTIAAAASMRAQATQPRPRQIYADASGSGRGVPA
jgi:O-antigen ligase